MRILQSPSEVSLKLQATLGPLIHIRVEYPESPALLLGPVHCRVGIHEKGLRRLRPVVTKADAYAGRGEQLTALQKERTSEFLSDPLCYTHCYLRTLDASISTTNSSPPKRARLSSGRRQRLRRWATSVRSTSPASWPNESFIILNSSRSVSRTATFRPLLRLVRSRAFRRRSTKSWRFGRSLR